MIDEGGDILAHNQLFRKARFGACVNYDRRGVNQVMPLHGRIRSVNASRSLEARPREKKKMGRRPCTTRVEKQNNQRPILNPRTAPTPEQNYSAPPSQHKTPATKDFRTRNRTRQFAFKLTRQFP